MVLKTFKKHPLLTMLGAGLLVCGSAMAALGINTPANDSPEIQAMIARVQQELPLNENFNEQSSLLEQYQYALYHDDYTRTSDTPQTLFERLNINDDEALTFLRNDTLARLILSSGRSIRVAAQVAPDGSLIRLRAYFRSSEKKYFQRVTIARDENNQLYSVSHTVPVEVHERIAMGSIKYSLYGATEAINLPNNIAYQLADIFESRIDFTRQVQPGDTFQLIYESYEADGQPLGTGKILAAQFVNAGRKLDAVWFDPGVEDFRGSYYTFEGKSLRTTFLAYPLEYTRISSQFGRRLHPILGTWRNHNGTDFAAPTGTPVRTVGDGRIKFAGVQNGYGNVIYVEHDRSRVTIYGHLSRIDVTVGQIVQQGDVIGAVGQTGWATGPHLHLEFHENGTRKDPAILAQQTETQVMPVELIPVFEQTVQSNAELIARVTSLMSMSNNRR